MRSPLCEAVVRCDLRRLVAAVVAAPVPAAIGAAIVFVAPFALARVGHGVGVELAGIEGSREVAVALVTGPMLAAAAAGAVLTLSLPGRSALGDQVAAGPAGAVVAVVSRLLVPALVLALTVVPSLAVVCVALAAELPGGPVAGAALFVATLAAVPVGAVVAEAGVSLARGRRLPAFGVAAGAAAWFIVGRSLGAGPLGPFAPVGGALRGPEVASAEAVLAGASAGALALIPPWLVLASLRPPKRVRSAKTRWRLVHPGRMAIGAAVAAVVTRRHEVRLAALCSLGFGAAGLATASFVGAPAPSGFLLATTTALLGSVVCPLAVCGALLSGHWLWAGGPTGRWKLAAVGCGVGLMGALAPVAVVGGIAGFVSRATWSTAGVVLALVVVGAAAALLAGTLVPWDGEARGDQMTSFAALVGMLIVLSLLAGLIGPRLVTAGVPDVLVVALVCGAAFGGAFPALGRRFGTEG